MRENSIDIWKKKLDWIVEQGGMALINVHPDYMGFTGDRSGPEVYPAGFYEEFLRYLKDRYCEQYWHVLPKDMAKYFLKRKTIRKEENIT